MSHFNLKALTSPISSREGMTHAVLQSLYNHAESNQNDRARMGKNVRGGTWGHARLPMVGSRDWTLKREKLTPQTLILAKRFYEEALAWLIADGYAKAIDVSVWIDKPNRMGRRVLITLMDGSKFEVKP